VEGSRFAEPKVISSLLVSYRDSLSSRVAGACPMGCLGRPGFRCDKADPAVARTGPTRTKINRGRPYFQAYTAAIPQIQPNVLLAFSPDLAETPADLPV